MTPYVLAAARLIVALDLLLLAGLIAWQTGLVHPRHDDSDTLR